MNLKFLAKLTNDAHTFEQMEINLQIAAVNCADSRKRLSMNAKANVYGIEARKARGEIAALIFGYGHYKGAAVMATQARINRY